MVVVVVGGVGAVCLQCLHAATAYDYLRILRKNFECQLWQAWSKGGLVCAPSLSRDLIIVALAIR